MSRTLTAADRSALIRLASALPTGSEERRAILAGLSNKTASRSNWVYIFGEARQQFIREVAFAAEQALLSMYRNDIKDSKVEGRMTMIKLHKGPSNWHEFRWDFDGAGPRAYDREANQMVLIYAAPGVGSGSSEIIKNLNPWQEASGVADEGLRGWKRRGFRDLNGNPIIL